MWPAVLLLYLFALTSQTKNCDPRWTFHARTHSCYLKATVPLEWQEAQDYCSSLGDNSNLASVLSLDELRGIQFLVDEFLTWIGLSLNDSSTWTDGNRVEFTNFLAGEPSKTEHCVAWSINDDGQNGWRTIACNYSQFFICKQPAMGPSPIVQNGHQGDFSSPGFPNEYENELTSHFFIETEADHRIVLTLQDVDTEANRDIISINDGFDRVSGQVHQRSVISRGNKMLVTFKTDDSDVGTGFRASWKSRAPDAAIQHLAEPRGEILSAGYPGPIPMFTVQRHLIRCLEETHVDIEIKEIDTSVLDKLRFFDEPPGDYPLPSFSGTATSSFSSSSPNVFIRFDAVDGVNNSTNWRLEYDCVRNDGLGEEIHIP